VVRLRPDAGYRPWRDPPETGAGGGLDLAYGDTVGDLALSTGGGLVGSLIAVRHFGPYSKELR